MLVLTRKPGEEIVIGGEIRVSVISLGPGRVKIGIEAPNWVAVDRGEVHERKNEEVEATGIPQEGPCVIINTDNRGGTNNRISGQIDRTTSRLPRKPR